MFMNVFLKILDMTRSASWMIPVVFAVRFLFRKLPKKYSYYLWMIVWIRLLVPFTIETEFSPVPYSEPFSESSVLRKTDLSVPESVSLIRENAVSVQTELPETAYSVSSAPLKDGVYRSRYIWLAGLAVSAAYSFASLISLNRKLRFSVP